MTILCAKSRLVGLIFPNHRYHTLRARGRAAAARGKSARAERLFDAAIAAAEKRGARYELARALLDKSAIVPEDAETTRERGLQILNELHCVIPEAEKTALKIRGSHVADVIMDTSTALQVD